MNTMRDAEITRIASRILSARSVPAHFVNAEARSITAMDGTPAVRVIAQYRDRKAAMGLDAMHAIRDALLSEGDDRFVFLENEFLDEPELPVDDDQ